MADIFLSYASLDKTRVEHIAVALKDLGFTLWWDEQIPAGQRFERVIHGALERAKAIVVVWSHASVESEWVYEEADVGKRRSILVPVFIDDCLPPLGFRQREGAKLIDLSADGRGVEWFNFVNAVESLLGPAPNKIGSARTAAEASDPPVSRDFRDEIDLKYEVSITLEEAFQGKTVEVTYSLIGSDGVPEQRTLSVNIPKGVKDGMRVRLQGEGNVSSSGKAGDLYLLLSVAPHPKFEREDDELFCRDVIPMTIAVLGGDVKIQGIGEEHLINIKPGTQTGRRFRLKGAGMPRVGANGRGDLHVEVFVETPMAMSGETLASFKTFAEFYDAARLAAARPGAESAPDFFQTVKAFFERQERGEG